jgi:hypothetical protein
VLLLNSLKLLDGSAGCCLPGWLAGCEYIVCGLQSCVALLPR